MSATAVCLYCGRVVRTYVPDLKLGVVVTTAHRVTMPHTIETPWCRGGGRPVVKEAQPARGGES